MNNSVSIGFLYFVQNILNPINLLAVISNKIASLGFSFFSVPGKVNNFQAISVKPNMITLQWTLPSSEQNGILTGFVITYFVKVSLSHFNKVVKEFKKNENHILTVVISLLKTINQQ